MRQLNKSHMLTELFWTRQSSGFKILWYFCVLSTLFLFPFWMLIYVLSLCSRFWLLLCAFADRFGYWIRVKYIDQEIKGMLLLLMDGTQTLFYLTLLGIFCYIKMNVQTTNWVHEMNMCSWLHEFPHQFHIDFTMT